MVGSQPVMYLGLLSGLSFTVGIQGLAGFQSSTHPPDRNDEEMIPAAGDGVPLAISGAIDDLFRFRVESKEVHGECGSARQRAVQQGGHAHDDRTFAGIVEVVFNRLLRFRIFNNDFPRDQVARLDDLPVGKRLVEECLRAGDHWFGLDDVVPIELAGGAFVQFVPVLLRVGGRLQRLAIHLAVEIAIDEADSLRIFRQDRRGLAAFGIERNDLAGGVAQRKVIQPVSSAAMKRGYCDQFCL